MSANQCKATGIIRNDTNDKLKLDSSNITAGSWSSPPVTAIEANTTRNKAFEAQGDSGTSGSIVYKSPAGSVTLQWSNVPADGPNSVTTTTSGNLGAVGDANPTTGPVAVFTYQIATV